MGGGNVLILQETPAGFALFSVSDKKVKKAETEVWHYNTQIADA